jgi:manganese-dependent ADP-ribose/CDP-alcohol diphosphatase
MIKKKQMRLLIATIFFALFCFNMSDNIKSEDYNTDIQSQKPLFSFGIFADVQYCDCDPVGTRFYRSSLFKLREAIKTLKDNSPEFIINLGDLIEKNFESYKSVLNIIDSSGFKIYHCTGNHDYSIEPRLKRRIPVLQSSKEGYYSFIQDKFRFIMLNGNDLSTYASNNNAIIKQANEYISSLKNDGEINAIDWNGGISSKQLDWLTNQLDLATRNNEKVILVCHFPVWPVNIHNLLNYREILLVLERYSNIIAWFNGHNHMGNYGNLNMIHFVTLKGMVETEKNNSFALVEVYKNKIWIKGYGREKSQILAF